MEPQPPVIVLAWFAASVFLAVVGNLVFYVWLVRRKPDVRFFWAGTPGYLDRHYRQWCEQNGKSPARVIAMRIIVLASAVASAIVMIGYAPR